MFIFPSTIKWIHILTYLSLHFQRTTIFSTWGIPKGYLCGISYAGEGGASKSLQKQLCRELVSINKEGNAEGGNRAHRSSVSLARTGCPLSSTEQVPDIWHLNFSVIICWRRALTGGFPGIPVTETATYTMSNTGGSWHCSKINRDGMNPVSYSSWARAAGGLLEMY